MKYCFKSSFILLFIIIFLFSSITISSADELVIIPNWHIESMLLENGDLSITEYITFKFEGKFNGVFREVVLDKTSGIEDIKVAEIIRNDELEYARVNNAKKGDSAVYLIVEDEDVKKIQIFSPSKDEEKTFKISYTVKNVAIRYNDIGELYYKFLGNENETPIDNFTVEIKLPKNDVDDKVRIFAHGPLNGKIIRKTNDIVYMQVKDVPRKTYVEGRILFPIDFIPNSSNIVNKNNYENILNQELAFQRSMEEKAVLDLAVKKTLGNISFIAAIAELFIFIILLLKLKRGNNTIEISWSASIPEECTPAVAAYLTNMAIDTNTIIATILDLFRKGYIRIDEGEEYKEKKKKYKEFIITKVKDVDDSLLSHEKYFINWILNEIGNKRIVTSKDIEEYSENNFKKFYDSYYSWQKKIKEDSIKKGYFDKGSSKYGTFLVIMSVITIVFSIVSLIYGSLLSLILLITSVVLLTYGITLFFRKSDYGYSQYKKWLRFKKYISNSKNYDDIDDFSRYPLDISLIYALALGIDKKMIKGLNLFSNNQEYVYSSGWLYWYILFSENKNNTFQKSIDNSFGKVSSTTGSGGGFTAGGGGGAGGGGAGGF